MKKLVLLLIFSLPCFAQNTKNLPPAPSVGQAVIHDVKDPQSGGFVQYRSVLSPMWTALSPGMKLGEGVLIRINDPNAQLTMGFPDGGFLRLIGVSSLYLDSISRITSYPSPDIPITNKKQELTAQSSYQTRILLLSGRWFYSANPMTPSTFVANSDVTTSVIENGSGGGYYIQGQGQMLVRSGLGRFGWRLTNDASGLVRSRPILLEPGQIVTMDIFKGFPSTMGMISESNYAEYGLFPPSPQASLSSMGRLSYWGQSFVAQRKNALTEDQINFEGLDSLQNLQFVRKEDALAVGIAKTTTNILVEAAPAPVLPRAIPLSLLKPINLADFEIAPPAPNNTLVANEEPRPQAPAAPVAAPRVRQKVEAPIAEEIETGSRVKAAREKIDLASATAGIEATPMAAAPAPRRRAAPAARVVTAETPLPDYEEAYSELELGPAYKTPDGFNRDHFTNDPAFQYKKFEVNDLEDLMKGDFSRSLFY